MKKKNLDYFHNSTLKKKIGLGTIQFSAPYGIANKTGQIKIKEIKKIKDLAKINDIRIIDTASAYGKCEEILGKVGFKEFDLITKLPVTKPTKDTKNWVIKNIKASLKKLKVKQLYAVHVHNTGYLFSNFGPQIYKGLIEAKKLGLIKKWGVSTYTIVELKKIISKYDIDLVLLPFNIFDQRTIKSNILKELKNRGIEIHARSTFLQGLLLIDSLKIPKQFNKWITIFKEWEKIVKKTKLTKFQICLRYALSNPYLDKIILGMDSSKHLNQMIKNAGYIDLDVKKVNASSEINLINPAKW